MVRIRQKAENIGTYIAKLKSNQKYRKCSRWETDGLADLLWCWPLILEEQGRNALARSGADVDPKNRTHTFSIQEYTPQTDLMITASYFIRSPRL